MLGKQRASVLFGAEVFKFILQIKKTSRDSLGSVMTKLRDG